MKRSFRLVCLLMLGAGPFVQAQVAKVPADIQMRLFMKILAYERDRRFEKEAVTNVVLLYHSKVSGSSDFKDKVMAFCGKTPPVVNQTTIRFVPLDLNTIGDVGQELKRQGARVVYLTPFRGVDVASIIASCREQSILSVSSGVDFAQYGVTVNFDLLDNKPKILINVTSAKLEQINFSSELLKLANVIY